MVQLGVNLADKGDNEQGLDEDKVPLITPLDVDQLEQPFPEKVRYELHYWQAQFTLLWYCSYVMCVQSAIFDEYYFPAMHLL